MIAQAWAVAGLGVVCVSQQPNYKHSLSSPVANSPGRATGFRSLLGRESSLLLDRYRPLGGRSAPCCPHALPHNDQHRAVIEEVRSQIWELYQDLKASRVKPGEGQRPVLEARFDALVEQRTGYPSIDGVLKEMRDQKADLLRVLERPEVPLHNNALESDIREFVKRRKISGGTRNDAGRRCRDTFASLKKTCRKLGVRFWDYLQDRVRGLGQIPRLAELIGQKARQSTAAVGPAVPSN